MIKLFILKFFLALTNRFELLTKVFMLSHHSDSQIFNCFPTVPTQIVVIVFSMSLSRLRRDNEA